MLLTILMVAKKKANKGENQILIDSRKDIATHDEAPEMKAIEITGRALKEIESEVNFILINFANPDMIGHTGNFTATVKAIETIDVELKKIVNLAIAKNSEIIITADHGNAEISFDRETMQKHTAHTSNLVPIIYIGSRKKIKNGGLHDIAPTVLDLIGLTKPELMTGKSLVS